VKIGVGYYGISGIQNKPFFKKRNVLIVRVSMLVLGTLGNPSLNPGFLQTGCPVYLSYFFLQ